MCWWDGDWKKRRRGMSKGDSAVEFGIPYRKCFV